MKRRDFLSNAALLTTGYAFLVTGAYPSNRYASLAIQASASPAIPFELDEITISELQQQFKKGVFTSEKITQQYLNRIEQLDKHGPAINSVIEVNPDALKIARQMDRERKSGKVRGPLHGIPVLIKDNIDTADQTMTTAGSLALVGNKASKDAFVVKQLREAGAVILGKTNLSEWANFRSTRSSSGWSSRGGQTKNPYVLDRSPCGSSSGSAVAVAANLCVVAVGTETNGSIACPASMNGIVGIKPTVGLVSRSGIIPISKTQDTAGPFARTVKDAAILLSVLAGMDPDDSITQESPGKNIQDYSRFCDSNGLHGKRIGVEKTYLKGGHEVINTLLQKALEQVKGKGATIVEVEFMSRYNEGSGEEFTLLQYEFKEGLNRYLASANAQVKSLEEVMAFNKKHEAKVMPYFKQEIMDSSQVKGDLDSKAYRQAVSKLTDYRKVIDQLFKDHKLDSLCGPATGFPWCIDVINGDSWTGYGAYGPAAVAGYPSITVPMGSVKDLPVGLSFFGRAYEEPKLISIGYAYEQTSKNRVEPKFKKTFGA